MKTLIPKTKEAVLEIARWQEGVMESPANSNMQKYGDLYVKLGFLIGLFILVLIV